MTADHDDGVDPSAGSEPHDERPELTSRQEEIAAELRRLHPDLASLYIRGVGLLPDLTEAGVPLVVAHIGRELARGVRDLLLEDEEFELPEAEAEAVAKDAKHRASIARTLQLPPNDPRVTRWFQVYNDLTGWAHFRVSSPDPEEVRRAYEDLETILHGRVGPYFATQAELDRFLAIEHPSDEDVEDLQPYLSRPAQRRYFFGELDNPAWVRWLVDAGTFSDPPEWIGNEEEGWRLRPWPEGAYLARVAQHVPDQVVRVVKKVSGELKNPAVWDALTRAALNVPPPEASEVVPKFREALQLPTASFFGGNLAELVQVLASDGQETAFSLAGDLLFVPSSDDFQGHEEQGDLPLDGRWLLPRIDWSAGEALFERAVPALEVADALRTLELLLSRLNQIAAALRDLEIGTLFWRPGRFDLEGEAERPDSPSRLFLEAVRVLRATAQRDEDCARRSLELVKGMSDDLARRLRYVLLAAAGHWLPEEVDDALTSEAAIRPGRRARELALFLREQFEHASPSARRLFRYAVEQGPTLSELREQFAFSAVEEPDEDDLQEARRSWQRRRILWFGERVPEELEAIAESVGITPGEEPEFRDRELAEVGFYTSGVSTVAPQSPLEDAELQTMTPDEIVRVLVELQEGTGPRRQFDIYGLSDALGRLAASDSNKVVEAATIAVEAALGPRYLRAFVEGLRKAVGTEATVGWAELLEFASLAVAMVVDAEDSEAAALGAAVAELLAAGFSEDSVPVGESSAAWEVLAGVAQIQALWETGDIEVGEDFHALLTMALNHPAGRLARAVCSGMLWLFRALGPDGARLDDAAPDAREAIVTEALPVLEEALEHTGRAGAAVEAIVGRYLPQVHYLAPDWLAERADTLLRPGCENPLEHPAWPSFLWTWDLVGPVFEAYRSCYLLAARSAPWLEEDAESGGGRSVADKLAGHLLVAVLQGAAAVGDDDELIETAFTNLPPSARAHAYWGVFRAWSDAEGAPPPEFVDRLLGLWRWRLEQLAGRGGADVEEEARGLIWLIHTPYLPDVDVVDLGARTVALAEGDVRINALWERLGVLASVDADATADIVLQAIDAELSSEHPLVSAEEGVPVIRRLLAAVDEDRHSDLQRMVDRLGEAGFEEFGELLEDDD